MESVAQIEVGAILPMLSVSVGAMLVLLAEVTLSGRRSFLGRPMTDGLIGVVLSLIAAASLAVAMASAATAFFATEPIVFNPNHPMVRIDAFAAFAIALLSLASFLVCWLSVTYLAEMKINHGEYYALVLLSTAGMMFLVAATDLMMLFLGLELMSIPIYVLAGFDRRQLDSNESALKYFLVGSFASGILLYGIALVYGTTGGIQYDAVRATVSSDNVLGLTGLAFLIVGFGFKVASVPFHQWAPDVYQGAPTSVTAYMAITVKVAAFAALLRLLVEAFGPVAEQLTGVFWILAALTVVLGNVMAVIQDNLKRLLAYSSVAHAGYILIGFVAGGAEGYEAVLFYLFVYVFMNLGAFAVIVALAHRGRDCEMVEDLAGLASTRPFLAALLTLFMISLAGIPGTAGFVGKFMVFRAAVDAGQVPLVIIGVLASLVSVYYYLRIPVMMYMRDPSGAALRQESSLGELLVLWVCAASALFFGIFPGGALEWARRGAALLF